MNKIEIIIQKRGEIVKKYCEKKGWDFNDLSFEQIIEIRSLTEWQNAGKKEN